MRRPTRTGHASATRTTHHGPAPSWSCAVAEEALQPGDWLAVHTDGVTEARDTNGTWFGEDRLVDLLTREVAGDQSPAETARRLMHAVLEHRDGVLQDDASVLLARWAPEPRGL